MKHIVKGNTPQELRHWFDHQLIEDGRRINCGYSHMPGDVKRAIKQRLLAEQGGLCCYTGLKVDEDGSHIEHFKPQSLCENHEDVDYVNLLAAYPGDNTLKCPYGAHAKADWYSAELLVSPLRRDCERRFRFDLLGQITPEDENDQAAVETIKRLCLDHDSLTEMRKQAIDGTLFRRDHPLSVAHLQRLANSYCERNHRQQFPEFCFVIVQAAQVLILKAERERRRKQAIRQQARR